MDYIISHGGRFRYGACIKQDCFTIQLIDDIDVEESESFVITLTMEHGPSHSVLLEENTLQIDIIDTDGMCLYLWMVRSTHFHIPVAEINFVRTIYHVIEEDGSVEICSEIESALNFPLNISFSTSNGTAGEATSII